MSAAFIGDCADCIDGVCSMNCSSALLVTGTEWIAASIWAGVFPTKATAEQVAEFRAQGATSVLIEAAHKRAAILHASSSWGSDADGALLDALAGRVEALEAALDAAANALTWAERRMACKAYAEVIANDERNARAALTPKEPDA